MENEKFQKELEETIKYANRHASDFFDLHGKNRNKIFSINKKDFICKCYEGFKLAQDKIIKNILEIEEELVCERKKLNNYKKGKHKNNLQRDRFYMKIENAVENLEKQKRSFQDIANVIVWTIFHGEGTYIRSFLKEDGGSGYLRDRDIWSSIKEAKRLNESKDTFTIINDITSCLHAGDLITVGRGRMQIAELKGGKINTFINKIVHDYFKTDKLDIEAMKELYNSSPNYGLKQLTRQMKQVFSFFRINRYIKTDKAYDESLELNKTATTILKSDLEYNDVIDSAIDDLYKSNAKYKFVSSDCCIVGLFKKNEYGSELLCQLGFKHYVYHSLIVPWEKCQYLYLKDIQSANFEELEMFKYQNIKIYLLAQKLNFGGYLPLFLTLKEKYIIDLLTDKLSIYIYFDHERFFEMCEEKGLNPKWINSNEKNKKKYLPLFDGKILQLNKGKISYQFANGTLFRIIYNFQYGYNIIEQIKEEAWVLSHPWLSKIRNYFHHNFFRFYIKWRFLIGWLNRKTRSQNDNLSKG